METTTMIQTIVSVTLVIITIVGSVTLVVSTTMVGIWILKKLNNMIFGNPSHSRKFLR